MKKSKRILSMLTALAITASAFASMVIPASAADDGATIVPAITYEGTGASADWTTDTEGRFTPILRTAGGNTFLTVNQAQRHQNTCTLTSAAIASEFTATRYAVEFDLRLGSSAGQDSAQFRVNTGDGYLITLDQADRNGGFKINGEKTVTFPGGGNSWNATADETIDAISWLHFTVCYGEGPTYVTVTNPALTGDSATVLAQTLVKSGTETGALTNMTFVSSRYDANFAIDNFTVRNLNEDEIPTIKYYNVNINTQRYAKIVYKIGEEEAVTTAADVNGKFALTNLPEDTNFEYTISKDGYVFEGDAETKTASAPLTETLNIDAPMTLKADIGVPASDLIYHENTFGYSTNKLDIAASNRMSDTALGTIQPEDDIYEILFDLNIPSAETSQVTVAFFGTTPGNNTDGNDIFGIQGTADGLFAFSDLNPKSTSAITQGWNQNCAGLYDNGVKLADTYTGEYKVDMIVDKENKTVTVKAGDNAAKTVTFTQDASKLTYLRVGKGGTVTTVAIDNLIVRRPDQNYVGVTGDDEFAKITGKTVTRQYNAEALVSVDGETFTWTITKADGTEAGTGISIDSNGVLSVTDAATPGNYKVKAASTIGGTVNEEKAGTIDITIAGVQEYIPTVDAPVAVELGDEAEFKLVKITDALGDDVTDYFTPVWSIEGAPDADASLSYTGLTPGEALAIYASYDSNALTSFDTEKVTVAADGALTVKAPSGVKVYIWDSLEGIKPISTEVKNAEVTELSDTQLAAIGSKSGKLITNENAEVGSVTVKLDITGNDITPKEYSVKVDKFYLIDDFTSGGTFNISGLVTDDNITGYLVTVGKNGEQLTQRVVDASSVTANEFTLPTVADADGAEVEVSPIFTYTTGLSNVYETPYTAVIPDGSYSVDFTKVTTARCDLKINDYIVVEEAGMGGNGRGVSETRTYNAQNVIVNSGKAVIGASGTCELASVKIVKEPDIVKRKTHIWIGGDSTVCRYDGNEETGDVKDLQTGWGQVIGTYFDDSVVISDLAESGSYIRRWFYAEYPTVRDMIQPGDYFIIQMGINDRSHTDTNSDDMQALLGQMVDEVRARGGIPVLLTPQKSVGYAWYSADAEKGDITTWNGAGISWSSYGFGTGAMKAVAEAKGTLFIDNASLTAEAFFKLGKDYVAENFQLSNEAQKMHWSYAGAQKIASMIAQSIYDQKKAGTKTSSGESFDGIPVITTGSGFTFTDSNGTSQTYNVVDLAN